MSGHTPGPWYVWMQGREATIWRRPSGDLYQNGGTVAGGKAIASVHVGWFGKAEQGYSVESNARLIAAAPELLEALKNILPADAYRSGLIVASDDRGERFEFANERLWAAMDDGSKAIAKATGEQA